VGEFFRRFGNMEFSNSGRGEIIYQKDTHPSLGGVALKLLVDFPEGGNFTCTEELSGESLAYLKEEYDVAAGEYDRLARRLYIDSSRGSLGLEQARRLWMSRNKSNPEAVAIIEEAFDRVNSLKGRMDEINNGVKLSLSGGDANGEVPGDLAWLENIPCDFAGVEVSKNNDGTYTAKIHVTEYKSDCTGYWADSIIYTITLTPDDEVLNITSERVKR